jgi:hypothetical protein
MKVITTYAESVELEGHPDGPPFLRRMADVFNKLADMVQPEETVIHIGVEKQDEKDDRVVVVCDCSGRGHGPECAIKRRAKMQVARINIKVEREL